MRVHDADVANALMSVSSTCDLGHRVVFKWTGGCIEHEPTKPRFHREDGVFQMMVKISDGGRVPVFTQREGEPMLANQWSCESHERFWAEG